MVSPKQLDFSSSDGAGDCDFFILSRRKSPRTPSSKRTAPLEVPEAEEETKKKRQRTDKKKKKKKKKEEETNTKLSSPSSNRIWNEEDELTLLKRLVDFRAKTGAQSKIDWEEFYRLLGGSIVEKFSKNQVYSKIRKLRRKYFVRMEKINQGNDPEFTRCSDSEAFGYSQMIWGQAEAATDKEMLNELVEEHCAGTENETGREAHQSKSGELKEHEEEAHDESLNEIEAVAENVTGSGEKNLKEQEEEAGNGHLNGNEAVAENVTGSGEKNLKEQEEEGGNERLNGNEAVAENVTGTGEKNLKEQEEEAGNERLNGNEAVVENVTGTGEKNLKEQEEEAGNERLNGNEAVVENVTGSGEKNLKEQEEEAGNERLNGNEAVTESGSARQAHQIETGEEMMKQQDEEAHVERLNENRAANITETADGKEGHGDNDEFCVVQDAFETLISQGLSEYQKKMQLEKLLNIGTDIMRDLSNEWKAVCVEERSLNLRKLRLSTKLAEILFK